MKTVSISMWYFSVALGNLIVIFVHKTIAFKKQVISNDLFFFYFYSYNKTQSICRLFRKQSHMFFMFTFSTLVAIIITYKLSNAYEKMYGDLKSPDAGNELEAENVDKSDIFMKQINLMVYFTLRIYVYLQLRCYKKKVIYCHFKARNGKGK